MKLIYIIFLSYILNTYAQKDTIYGVISGVNPDGIMQRYTYKDFKKIVLKDSIDVRKGLIWKCSYYSIKNDICYYLRDSKKKKTTLIVEKEKGSTFTGIAKDGSSYIRIITKVKNGIPVRECIYDSINRIQKYYKIKLGKVEEGYMDRTIFKKPYYEYFPNGNIKVKSQKKDFHFYGRYKEYHKNGKLKVKGKYNEEGKKIGNWKYYDSNGKFIGS